MAWLMTPPTAPPADTSPHTMPVERRDTNGTTPYTDPQVPYGQGSGFQINSIQKKAQGFIFTRNKRTCNWLRARHSLPHTSSGGLWRKHIRRKPKRRYNSIQKTHTCTMDAHVFAWRSTTVNHGSMLKIQTNDARRLTCQCMRIQSCAFMGWH